MGAAVLHVEAIGRDAFTISRGEVLMPLRDGELARLIRETGGADCAIGTGGSALKVTHGGVLVQADKVIAIAEWRGLLFADGAGI